MSTQADVTRVPGKILNHEAGQGTVTEEMVLERAREIAKADGRTEANARDREAAMEDLLTIHEAEPVAPELDDPDIENVTEWDTPPEATGTAAPKLLPGDDVNIAEELISEGLEEADHDQRVTAARENPPEKEEV